MRGQGSPLEGLGVCIGGGMTLRAKDSKQENLPRVSMTLKTWVHDP